MPRVKDATPGTITLPLDPDRRHAMAELVLEIATAAAGELDLDRILQAALDRLGRVVAITGGSIALVDGDDLVIRAASGPFVGEALGQRLPRGRGRSWQVVDTLEPGLIDDFQASAIQPAGAAAKLSMRSWLAVAISRRGEGIGLLEIDSTEPSAFTADDVQLLETVAQALAGPIDLSARYAAEQRSRVLRDAFTGMVSHELRTPVTTIFGMSQLLRQRQAEMDADRRGQLIEDIEAEADRLRRLVEDLLILGRAEAGKLELPLEPVALGHVLKRAVDEEARRWPSHQFAVMAPADLPVVLAEEVSVEQVIRNLAGNAAKYSAPGTTVTIEASESAQGVELAVIDEGIGLPPGDPDQLFELYWRSPEAARAASGAGVGLFVVRQLLAAMGGRVRAERRAGGSAFIVTLQAIGPDG
jgi:two-component system sensor histidine kinase KdpD